MMKVINRETLIGKLKDYLSKNITKDKLVSWAENVEFEYAEDIVKYESGYEEFIDGFIGLLGGADIPGFLKDDFNKEVQNMITSIEETLRGF